MNIDEQDLHRAEGAALSGLGSHHEELLRRMVALLQYPAQGVQDFLDFALKQALLFTDSRFGYIYHYSEARQEFTLNTWSQEAMQQCQVRLPQTRYELAKTGLWGEAVRQRRPIVVNDFQASHPLKRGIPEGHVRLDRFLTVPVFQGIEIVGVIGLANKAQPYHESDVLEVSILIQAAWKVLGRLRAEEDLRANQALLKSVLDCSDDAIFVKDAEGHCILHNEALARFMRELLGASFPADGILGKLDRDYLPETVAGRFETDDASVRSAGLPVSIEESFRIGGEERTYQTRKHPFPLAGGTGILGVARDISELKRVQQDLARRRDEAEAADRAKSTFLAMMSHELRTPLNGILGFSELLAAEDLPPHQRDFVSRITRCGRNLLALVSDILDLSRIEAERMELDPVPCRIRDLAQEALDPLEPVLRAKDLSCSLDCDPSLQAVLDPKRVRQILFNMLSNAVKFTRQGSVSLRIAGVRRPDGRTWLDFTVTDTGIGIAPQDLARLFQPFTQIDSSLQREHQGSGLGLVIARRLAQLMGGDVTLRSEPGRGTTAALSLAVPSVPDAPPARSEDTAAGKRSGCLDGITVLAVDDNEDNLCLLEAMLRRLVPAVTVTTDPARAVELAAANRYTHVFIDVRMPGMDGPECLRRIRAAHPAPVVCSAVTAHAMPGDRERLLDAGFDRYLAKPLGLDDLARVFR